MGYINNLSPDVGVRTLQLLRAIVEITETGGVPTLSTDTQTQSLQLAETLARKLGLLPGPGSPEPPMADVTTTIGTNARDYSTITAWESDLDNVAVYSSGDVAIGRCYADSTFAEAVTVNGGGTVGLSSIELDAADGEQHDGTASTGVTNSVNPGLGGYVFTDNELRPVRFKRIVIKPLSTGIQSTRHGVQLKPNLASSIRQCIVDGTGLTGSGGGSDGIDLLRDTETALNNIILNITGDGLHVESTSENSVVSNNTIYNCTAEGFNIDETTITVQNNIAVGNGTDFTGTPGTASHNLSEDASAPGTSPQTSDAATEFVSTVGGSEDLHLKTGATAIDTGTDLATTPTGVNLDIDGRDRDAEGDTWDIGADEFVVVGGAANPKNVFGLALDGPLRRVVLQ